jgi:hypothetical protein
LEISNSFAKLFSRIRIRHRLVKRALRKTNHLCGNTDSAFVEDINGDLCDARSWCQIKEETRREEGVGRANERTLYPLPTSPTTFSLGTLTSSKLNKQVDEALIPSYQTIEKKQVDQASSNQV